VVPRLDCGTFNQEHDGKRGSKTMPKENTLVGPDIDKGNYTPSLFFYPKKSFTRFTLMNI
jgi:hypothetical protein